MTTPNPDPVDKYLAELRASLRGPDTDGILAEAEDHLREGVAAGQAAGLTETDAQEAAITAFGPGPVVPTPRHPYLNPDNSKKPCACALSMPK